MNVTAILTLVQMVIIVGSSAACVSLYRSRRRLLAQERRLTDMMGPTLSPEPPVNITIHLHDGTVVPADAMLSHAEFVWRVDIGELSDELVESVHCDQVPPHTRIEFGTMRAS